MVHAGLVALDGQAYLTRQAEQSPRAFLALVAKVLAAELSASRAAASRAAPGASRLSPGICELVHAVLIAVGGHAYLARHADKHPRVFLSLLGKLLAAELRPAEAQRRKRSGAGSPEGEQSTPVLPHQPPHPGPRAAAPPPQNAPHAAGRAPARSPGAHAFQTAPLPPRPTAAPSTLTRCVASLATLAGPAPSRPLAAEPASLAEGRAAGGSSASKATTGQGTQLRIPR